MENNNSNANEAFYDRVVSASLRIAFVALLFILSFIILKPFLIIILWSIIIAVGVFPIFKKFSKMIGNKDKLASVLLVLVALAVIAVPSVLLLESTIESVSNIAEQISEGTLEVPPPQADVAEWPIIGKPIYKIWKLASTNLKAAIKTMEPQIKEYGPKIIGAITGLGGTLLLSIISIIIAGVLLLKSESGEKTTHKIFKLLIGKEEEEITNLAVGTIRSVVQGVLGVAIIQSVAAGIVLLIFDIPAAGLWALIVLFLAVIQLPPIIILLPISIYGFSIMDTTSAVIFLILSIIISMSDALLKPIFLGRGVDVPMLAILLGAIGGMMVMGIMGLFIGAVALALAYKIFNAMIAQKL